MTSKTSKNQGHAHRRNKLTDSIKAPAKQGILFATIRGVLASVILFLLLLAIATVVLYRCADPTRWVMPTSLTVLYVCCFFGGLIGAKQNRGGALLCGVTVSSLFLLLLFIASLLLNPTLSAEHSLPLSFGLRGIGIALAIPGAFLGTGEKKNKKKNHKK